MNPVAKPCFNFARGSCRFGSKCKFQHDASAPSPESGQMPLENLLRSRGETRSSNGSHSPAEKRPPSAEERKLRDWQFKIPTKDRPGKPLGHQLHLFFQSAYDLSTSGTDEIRQTVITKLATEYGLQRVKELLDADFEDVTTKKAISIFTSSMVPFFQVITHDSVLRSLLLETAIDTIFHFLFGPSGQRSIKVFGFVSSTLSKIDLPGNFNALAPGVCASLAALRKTIEANGTALLLEQLPPIVSLLSTFLNQLFTASNSLVLQRAKKDLSAIEARLGVGKSIPSLQPKAASIVPSKSLQVVHDQPGSLSAEGRRHDNDHEDISKIRILPTASEILSDRSEYLPTRDLETPHLSPVKSLLDRNFRLLREDTVGQLRDSIALQLQRLELAYASETNTHQYLRTVAYENVKIKSIFLNKTNGLGIIAEFDQPLVCQNAAYESQRREWWDTSKRMQFESLLCLIDNTGRTLFLSVADQARFAKELGLRTDAVLPGEGKVASSRPFGLSHDRYRALVVLHLIENHPDDMDFILRRSTEGVMNLQQTLVEFPGVVLPAFRPTLQALQQMSDQDSLPLEDLLTAVDSGLKKAVVPPDYALQDGFEYDLEPILRNDQQLTFSPTREFNFQALLDNSSLDESQATALIDSLSRNLALVQGPPGTGKSYTGCSLIKVLLHNRDRGKIGPIICVCYTNHALDQLLEQLVRDGLESLVRLGSRSKSKMLEQYNIMNICRHEEKTRPEKQKEWKLRSELDNIIQEAKKHFQDLYKATPDKTLQAYLEANYPDHFDELFGEDEDGFKIVYQDPSNAIRSWLREGLRLGNQYEVQRPDETLLTTRLRDMNGRERMSLHSYWVADIEDTLRSRISSLMAEFTKAKEELDFCRQEIRLRCLQSAHVIGTTTTGLARNIDLFRRLDSKVLICEEAGEVLEAHILTALLPCIEHAVLIGDHQQLRPQIQKFELSHENPGGKRYSLDVSLFERLVQPTADWMPKIPFSTLETQRRMHPSISDLIRSTLYPRLRDHSSVSEYPEVVGIRKRLFWLNHSQLETKPDSSHGVSTSKINVFESEMVAALVSHLVRQGEYQSDEIAVLTPYLGQLQLLRRRLISSFEIVVSDLDEADLEKEGIYQQTDSPQALPTRSTHKTSLLKTLRLATVDNFQGEEAKVVIISLVRCNTENKCGFLKTSNRINVLLSRARHGMFIIGNTETSAHVPMWGKVLSLLEASGNVGNHLPLRCPRHPDIDINAATPDDFSTFSPEGGCNNKCKWRLGCGHSCKLSCHSETLHSAVMCLEPCQRTKEGCDHPCALPCGKDCGLCTTMIKNVRLACGHVTAELQCHQVQDLSKVRCRENVLRSVPGCEHQVIVPCCIDVTEASYRCSANCEAELACGHKCLRKCYQCNRREDATISDTNHGKCGAVCGRPYRYCSHQCRKECHGASPCPLCEEPCEIECAHSRCSKKCKEPCAPCSQECSWTCPHHQESCQMPCAVPCDVLPCSERCSKFLDCGHPCPSICGENCPTAKYCHICAQEDVKSRVVDYIMQSTYGEIDPEVDPVIVPPCGHLMTLSSMDGIMAMSMFYELSDESTITAVRSLPERELSEAIKVCPMCRGPLRSINRYSRIIRGSLLEQSTRKFLSWANQGFLSLQQKLSEQEAQLQQALDDLKASEVLSSARLTSGSSDGENTRVITLEKSAGDQVTAIRKYDFVRNFYKSICSLGQKISGYSRKVREAEQPFGRIFDMVQDAKQRRGIEHGEIINRSVLNTRFRMLAFSLKIRCDLAIISNFLALRQKCTAFSAGNEWITAEVKADFSINREECVKLFEEAIVRHQPMHEVEGRLYWAQWSLLERSTKILDTDKAEELHDAARTELDKAEEICIQNPGQTKGLLEAVQEAQESLDAPDVFYQPVNNEERRQVYAAMATEFSGTGHWYVCANGHPFTIGECGMPMQSATCSQCGASIGGQGHQLAQGVTRAREFEEQFARLQTD